MGIIILYLMQITLPLTVEKLQSTLLNSALVPYWNPNL